MKIYLVTMKALPDDNIHQRLTEIKKESEYDGEGEYIRQYSWVKKSDDEKAFKAFAEALEVRIKLLDKVGVTLPGNVLEKEPDGYTEFRQFVNPTFACTGKQVLQILEVDDTVSVKSAASISDDSMESIIERFEAVVAKMEALDIPIESATAEHVYNEHCDVHVPGNVLISYNETLLLEDSCTDILQGYLNSGWRIVAVCPQAQRRPDYILGRYNPEIDIGGSARRG